jgi:hypothetical protein
MEEPAQVSVTWLTVTNRQVPPEPARYGTQMARGPVTRKALPLGGCR